MIRAVLDTNVVISSFISRKNKPPHILLSLIRKKKIIHVTSVAILEEVEDVLNRQKLIERHRLSSGEIRELIINLASVSDIIIVKSDVRIIQNDPEDDKFIQCAIDGKADYIISGDNHLLELKSFQQIKILSPKDFLKYSE